MSVTPLRQIVSDGGFSAILQEILKIINSASVASIVDTLHTYPSGDINENHCDHLVRECLRQYPSKFLEQHVAPGSLFRKLFTHRCLSIMCRMRYKELMERIESVRSDIEIIQLA